MPRPPIGRRGATVDTAHAMVGPTTTKEVLYVSATRGKEANFVYVDTHYDPDPQTSHGETLEPITAKEVLTGVLRNEGAEVAAHEAIRRELHEAQGMERLCAEYQTLATEAQAERWDALLARSGLSDDDLAVVTDSAARGPLFAALRDAEARGLDVDDALPRLVAGRSLADAADVASVLHGRVDRWTQASSGRRRQTGHLIAGLIPRVQGVSDPDMARALFRTGRRHRTTGPLVGTRGDRGQPRLATALGTPAERTRPAGALVARSVDRRGLPGPLAHRGSRPPRPGTGSGEPRTNRTAREGALGREVGEGDQHTRSGPAEQSSLGATGRDFAGDRNLRELSLVLTCPLPAHRSHVPFEYQSVKVGHLSPARWTLPDSSRRARCNSLVGRYYDPGTGQFLSVDPDVAETGQPYAYTGDDPVNAVDPLGTMVNEGPGEQIAGNSAACAAAASSLDFKDQVDGILDDEAAYNAVSHGSALPFLEKAGLALGMLVPGFDDGPDEDLLSAAGSAGGGAAADEGTSALSFVPGDLFETSISSSAGNVGVLAEVGVDGSQLTLSDVTVYGESGDLVNEVGPGQFLALRNEVAQQAAAEALIHFESPGFVWPAARRVLPERS